MAGSPPFGIFVSELIILKGMLADGAWFVAGIYLAALAVIFVGMSVAVLRMVQGARPLDMSARPRSRREPLWSVVPPLALAVAVLGLGLWVPAWLWRFLEMGGRLIGGQ